MDALVPVLPAGLYWLDAAYPFGREGCRVIERHYRTAEVAELLSCHPETILRLAQRGQLRSVRIGHDRRYPESAVQEFLDANTEGRPARVASLAGKRNARPSTTRRTA